MKKKYIIFFLCLLGAMGVSFVIAKKYLSKVFLQKLLAPVDISINGNASCYIIIHNDNFYNRVLSEGSLGLGRSIYGWLVGLPNT